MKFFYLILAVIGVVIPYSQFIPFLVENGLDIPLLLDQLFANRISAFFGWDVVISAGVLVPFIVYEGKKLGMRNYWLPIAGTLLAGVSFGLPFFLFMRERHFDQERVQP